MLMLAAIIPWKFTRLVIGFILQNYNVTINVVLDELAHCT